MLFAAVLSVSACVGGCWWPTSSRAVLVDVTIWQFSNNPPNCAYVVDVITFLIILHSACTGPFSGGIYCIRVLYFGPRKKYTPDLLRVSGSDL